MSETIRLNKVLKELNISIDRAVDYLSEQGIQIERTPNTKIDQSTYSILIKEFQSDAEQKAASEEVIINKIPERKPEPVKMPEPEPKPEVPEEIITAKVELEGPKTIGKIDLDKLNPPKPKAKEQEKPVEKPVEKPAAPVEKKEEKPVAKVEEEKKETVQPKEEKPAAEKEKESKPTEPASDEPIKIETK